ncbi:hypothetical protein EDC04DRAFT_826951 [Pisolithus marmoratus]|nr:hypothetical protein EDC04DRAFT_826951 [Pisolithus marmoratus]
MQNKTEPALRYVYKFSLIQSPRRPRLQYIMSTAEEELQALYNELWQIRVVNYFTTGVAFLTYDILTNLDREIPLIWRYYHDTSNERGRARRILVQMLFVFGRYYGLLYLVCKAFYAYCLFAGEILYTTLVDAILVIRLNAMYQIFHGTKGLRKYQIFLVSVVIIEFVISMSVCINTASWILTRVVEPPAGIPWPGCMISENPNNALTLPSCCHNFSRTLTQFALFEHGVEVPTFGGLHDLQY